jgi:Regulator of ribonuclease activity B
MQITLWLLVLAALVAVVRVYLTVRRASAQRKDDWDERLVKNLRAQGGDVFRPYAVDFFFDLPNQAACEQLGELLRAREFTVDYRQVDADRGDRFTLHAFKSLRISVPDMQALTREFKELAVRYAGRYDGWAAEGMTREVRR